MPVDPKFKKGKRSYIFDAFVAVLRTSPSLVGVTTVRSWKGDSATEDLQEPVVSACPWIRVTPGNSRNARLTEVSSQIIFVLNVEIAVAGTNVENLLNLWDSVEDAFGRDAPSPVAGQTIREFFRHLGGTNQGTYEWAAELVNANPTIKDKMMFMNGTITARFNKTI